MQSRTAVAVGLLFGLLSSHAYAQDGRTPDRPFEETSAGRAMQRITFGAIDCTDPPVCSTDAFTTSGLFINGTYKDTRLNYANLAGQADVSNSLLQLIVAQSQTFPNASTASGFTFTIGPSQRPELESRLYGPLFGERALTNGKKHLSVTLNAHNLRFKSLNGSQVRNADSGLLWGDTNYDLAGGGYVGICRMDIDTTSVFAAANYGLAEKLDVSLAVPIVHTSVEGSNEFLDFVFVNNQLGPSTFEPQGRYFVKGSSTGLGDIAVGAKYAFVRKADAGVALSLRASLPTGSLDDMTGTGEFQTAVNFISSFERQGFSPHVNIGYIFANGDVFDEANYNIGLGYTAVADRLTVGGELVGRRLFNVTQFSGARELGFITSPVSGEQFLVRDFVPVERDENLVFFAVGGKVRIAGQVLASMYFVLPTGSSGLHVMRPTLNVGINLAR